VRASQSYPKIIPSLSQIYAKLAPDSYIIYMIYPKMIWDNLVDLGDFVWRLCRLDHAGVSDADQIVHRETQVDAPLAGADQYVRQLGSRAVDKHVEGAVEERQRRDASHLQAGQRFGLFV